ncbi:MAG: hypothetical protein ACQESA_01515, partial [Patescibacteria group bacterium]
LEEDRKNKEEQGLEKEVIGSTGENPKEVPQVIEGETEKQYGEEKDIPDDIRKFLNSLKFNKNLTEEEAKKEWKKLMLKYHFDHNSGNDNHNFAGLINGAFSAWKKGETVDVRNESEAHISIGEDHGTEEGEEGEGSTESYLEKMLKNSRKEFAKIERKAEAWVKENKNERTKEGYEGYEETKQRYLENLRSIRNEKLKALESKEISYQEKERIRKEILKTTVADEAIELHNEKMNALLEEKSESLRDKALEMGKNAANWYRKWPLRYKLGISALFFGASVGAGAIGGATGLALAGGVVAGSGIQRLLSGAATAVGLDVLIHKSQDKKTEKETLKQFAEGFEEKIKNSNAQIDERLFELEGKKTGERYRRYILSGTAGALVGTGVVGKAFGNVMDWIGSGGTPPTEGDVSIDKENYRFDAPEFKEPGVMEGDVSIDKENYRFDVPEFKEPGVMEGDVSIDKENYRFDVPEFEDPPDWV